VLRLLRGLLLLRHAVTGVEKVVLVQPLGQVVQVPFPLLPELGDGGGRIAGGGLRVELVEPLRPRELR